MITRSKITRADAEFIRKSYKKINSSRSNVMELADRFGICREQILRIVRGAAWK